METLRLSARRTHELLQEQRRRRQAGAAAAAARRLPSSGASGSRSAASAFGSGVGSALGGINIGMDGGEHETARQANVRLLLLHSAMVLLVRASERAAATPAASSAADHPSLAECVSVWDVSS